MWPKRRRDAHGLGHCMRAFERRQNAFGPRQLDHRIQSGRIIARNVFRAAGVVQHGVLGTDRGVVEARGNRVRERDLPIVILQNVRKGTLQHPRRTALESGRVLAQRRAAASGLYADQPHLPVGNKLVKRADGVRSAADACDDGGRQPAFFFKDLRFHLAADAAMKVAHHGGIGMRAQRAAER